VGCHHQWARVLKEKPLCQQAARWSMLAVAAHTPEPTPKRARRAPPRLTIPLIPPHQRRHHRLPRVDHPAVVRHVAVQVRQHVGYVGHHHPLHRARRQQAQRDCAGAGPQLQHHGLAPAGGPAAVGQAGGGAGEELAQDDGAVCGVVVGAL